MSQYEIDNQYLLDRTAIYDVIARYFHGIDCRNLDEVRSCFTEDVQAHYHERPAVRGIDEFVKTVRTFNRTEAAKRKISTHFMGNLNILLLKGDLAETETNAIAFLVHRHKPKDQVSILTIRYLDRLRRVKDGWRISERIMTLDWSCHVPATFAMTMAQRITALPDLPPENRSKSLN